MVDHVALALKTMAFDPKWLESGFVDEAFLLDQLDRFESSDDKNSEHYRYGGFLYILRLHNALTDTQLDDYIALVDLDPDYMMSGAALADLLDWPALTPAQLQRVRQHPRCEEDWLQRRLRRIDLKQRLGQEEMNDDLFARIIDSHDEAIQRRALQVELTLAQLEKLAESGTNKAIRNMAGEQIKRYQRNTRSSNAR